MTDYLVTDTWLGEKCDTLADILQPGLTCVFVGLNPSVVSVEKGHYLQGTLGRQFWALLHAYQILPRPENGTFPDETLLDHGFGITDLVKRPTPRANELTREEVAAGASILRHKIETHQPKFVCSVYKSTLEALAGNKYANHYGLLDDKIGDTRLFAAPFPYRSREEVAEHLPRFRQLLAEVKNGH
jgi:double-stranded uracil-DNA glycosylase